jgi:hypothetical protein
MECNEMTITKSPTPDFNKFFMQTRLHCGSVWLKIAKCSTEFGESFRYQISRKSVPTVLGAHNRPQTAQTDGHTPPRKVFSFTLYIKKSKAIPATGREGP